MLRRLVNFFRGNVTVEVTGAALERFLNLCAANNIAFWDTRRVEVGVLRATIQLEGFFRIRKYAKKCMCQVRVVGKSGLPFTARRYERRYALWAGMLLCVGVLWFLSGFIWTIGIEGAETIGQVELLARLEREGLTTGVRRGSVDPAQIRNSLLGQMDDLSFLAVNIKGTHAQVVVRERIIPPEVVAQDVPCNIVADKTGVIVALRVMAGKAMVKVGETLMPGDLIASGTLTSTQNLTWHVHALAEADIRTWYTEKRRIPETVQVTRPTGEQVTRRALVIGNRRINLYLVENEPFAWYDKRIEKKHLNLSENFRFPIGLITETYVELETAEASVDAEKAAALLEGRMGENLAAAKPDAQITSSQYRFAAVAGGFEGVLEVECLETTGVEKPF